MIGPDLYSFRALWRQYRGCRRNKRNTHHALAFEVDAEAKLLVLQQELREHTYRPGRSICFVTGGPKPREVFAADFRDRIVHHVLVARQERVFERFFIHDSYACRRGKGTLAASDRLMTFLRRATANGRRPAWALKLDVASFFPTIHKQTLYEIIATRIRHPELLWLTRTLLFHDPTRNYRFRALIPEAPGPGSERAHGFPAQYKGLVRHAGERCLVFCQVGRFVEFRGPQRGLAERTLGLRRVYLPRAGYAFAAGFPMPLLAIYKTRAIECGVTVVDARERLVPPTTGGKARRPIEVLVPVQGAGLGRAGSQRHV